MSLAFTSVSLSEMMHGAFYSVKQESRTVCPRGLPLCPIPHPKPSAARATGTVISAAMKKLLLAVLVVPLAAHAQAWPSKPIRWVVPYTGGGITDVVTRV